MGLGSWKAARPPPYPPSESLLVLILFHVLKDLVHMGPPAPVAAAHLELLSREIDAGVAEAMASLFELQRDSAAAIPHYEPCATFGTRKTAPIFIEIGDSALLVDVHGARVDRSASGAVFVGFRITLPPWPEAVRAGDRSLPLLRLPEIVETKGCG